MAQSSAVSAGRAGAALGSGRTSGAQLTAHAEEVTDVSTASLSHLAGLWFLRFFSGFVFMRAECARGLGLGKIAFGTSLLQGAPPAHLAALRGYGRLMGPVA